MIGDHQSRDATRGGVNGPALPVQRGRERPLLIEEARPPVPAGRKSLRVVN
jgi:hypothetical protein